ncbi:MAG: glycosyl transferase [Chitinophagaceae bacterium]|nr:glycosyl transferase [Chitinophagaceae bacterium]
MLRWWNYRLINRFSQCWVPDFADANNLAGELSHPVKKPVTPIYYLGAISRFKRWPVDEKSNHLLVILSGPEPQRSIFENILIDQLVHYNGTVDFVRGLPSAETILPSTNQLHFYNHLSASELNKKMLEAAWIISRSGYSTVMDLVQLQKKSILVATPGQTEQQYLAHHLMQKGIAFCVKQEGFSLQKELKAANFFSYTIPATGEKKLEEIVRNFVSNLI